MFSWEFSRNFRKICFEKDFVTPASEKNKRLKSMRFLVFFFVSFEKTQISIITYLRIYLKIFPPSDLSIFIFSIP